MAPIILYSDDTSGNRSRKWNKFDLWCMAMAGLPNKEARKFKNINYITCSNNLTVLNMAAGFIDDLLSLEQGIVVYDSVMKQKVIVISPVLCILGDNVRASEVVNHLGSRANLPCRICMVRVLKITVMFYNYQRLIVKMLTLLESHEAKRKVLKLFVIYLHKPQKVA